jgi:hypothetical protein
MEAAHDHEGGAGPPRVEAETSLGQARSFLGGPRLGPGAPLLWRGCLSPCGKSAAAKHEEEAEDYRDGRFQSSFPIPPERISS